MALDHAVPAAQAVAPEARDSPAQGLAGLRLHARQGGVQGFGVLVQPAGHVVTEALHAAIETDLFSIP